MSSNLHEMSLEALQDQLLVEVDARIRLQDELRLALRVEKNLRLENDFLRLHLKGKHPGRIKDVAAALKQLDAGVDVGDVIQDERPLVRRTASRLRKNIGRIPGVRQTYHGLKNLIK